MAAANVLVVVEDDDGARGALGSLLSAEGYQVALAADGREALDFLANGLRPSLILLDMILPNLDGWSFMTRRRAKPEVAAIPVVIVTGLTVASDEWAKSLGAAALVRKPIDSTRLLELVRQHCPV